MKHGIKTLAYDIVIEENGIFSGTLLSYCRLRNSRFAILTDSNLRSLYAEKLQSYLASYGFSVEIFTFPAGEKNKTRQTKEKIEDEMFAAGFGKDSCILALGGGVVSDMAGFVASTFCRGIPWIVIPSSLLGMVDAAIGGKCGVNTSFGKNLIGSLYPPQAVLIDITVLDSLPLSEYKMGIVEMIKHGLILDGSYFAFLEENAELLLQKERGVLEQAIYQSALLKSIVVKQERESEIRHILNFGHTVGHALEKVSQNLFSHGQAVAMGLIAESHLSLEEGFSQMALERVVRCLHLFGIDIFSPFSYSLEMVYDAMAYDKKSILQVPHFVMIEEIGKHLSFGGEYCRSAGKQEVLSSLKWMKERIENVAGIRG